MHACLKGRIWLFRCLNRPNMTLIRLYLGFFINLESIHIMQSMTGLQIRVCFQKLIFLFLNQNRCFGFTKNSLNEMGLSAPKTNV